ncbi:CIC11C00000001526 [Sungouiella intermedia]|uniref:CIC11C00000001526 n=1 Tax=Sungouiella intermedia TaxID=45354 RepID=A0A1L0BXM4_9ASCO|nr:CIC11C00000001526 [[Candida] intermedia]
MSGSNYLLYQGSGRGDRSDSYHDRRYDGSPRHYRDRGGHRGRGYDNYRGGYRGRDYGSYRDSRDRDPRDRDPRDRDPRDRDPRDRDPRERDARERDLRHKGESRERDPRDRVRDREYREDYRREDDELRSMPDKRDRPDRPDRPDKHDRHERRPPRGGYRGNRGDREGFRAGGNDSPEHNLVSGGATPKDRGSISSSKFSDPWITILRIGEGKTAARMDAAYKELSNVNKTISELQADAMKLTSLLEMLEVYASRDALNVEISKEKLDEFTYL